MKRNRTFLRILQSVFHSLRMFEFETIAAPLLESNVRVTKLLQ